MCGAWMKLNNNAPAFCLCETPFGPVALLWSIYGKEPKIRRILLSQPGGISAWDAVKNVSPDSQPSSCPEIEGVLDQIKAYLTGRDVRFSLERLCLDLRPPFQRSVLLADYAIPRGRVSPYSWIARRLDNPKGARAVGTALANNPFPLIIPCHRAIRSDGSLGGFQYGPQMKKTLLEMEGIVFRDEGHVATEAFFYQDEAGKVEGKEPGGRKP